MTMRRIVMIAVIIVLLVVLLAIILLAYFSDGFRFEKEEPPAINDEPVGYIELSYDGGPVTSDRLPDGKQIKIDVRSSSAFTVDVSLNVSIAIARNPGEGASVLSDIDCTRYFDVRVGDDFFLMDISRDLELFVRSVTALDMPALYGLVSSTTPYFTVDVKNEDGCKSSFSLRGFFWEGRIQMSFEEATIG